MITTIILLTTALIVLTAYTYKLYKELREEKHYNKLYKAELELHKEITIHTEKVYVPEKKKTWSKRKPGTLSRSQVWRRNKKNK